MEVAKSSSLDCPICFTPYSSPDNRPTAIIPCLHTVCEDCFKEIKSRFNPLTCPECRGEVKSTQINRILEKAIQELSEKTGQVAAKTFQIQPPVPTLYESPIQMDNSQEFSLQAQGIFSEYLEKIRSHWIFKPSNRANELLADKFIKIAKKKLDAAIERWDKIDLEGEGLSSYAIDKDFRISLGVLSDARNRIVETQLPSLSDFYAWFYFITLASTFKDPSLKTMQFINKASLCLHKAGEERIHEFLKLSEEIEKVEHPALILFSLKLLLPLLKGEGDNFLNGIKDLCKSVKTREEQESMQILTQVLADPLSEKAMIIQTPINRLYLNGDTRSFVEDNFRQCIEDMLSVSPATTAKKECFLLSENNNNINYFNFLLPTLAKAGIKICDIYEIMDSNDYAEKASTSDIAIVVISSKFENELRKNAGHTKSCQRLLINRINHATKFDKTYIFHMDKVFDFPNYQPFKNYTIIQPEDQFISLITMIGSIHGLSDEEVAKVINRFKESCDSLISEIHKNGLSPEKN